jgi:RNA polymerase sigma-70 factor (sigma-E family)
MALPHRTNGVVVGPGTARVGPAGADQGADASFRAFVEGSWHRLLRTAYLLTGDHGTAEDLVQTALMRTYKHWGRIERGESPEAYVRRAMANITISAWRRRRLVEHATADIPETAESADHQQDHAVRDELWRTVCAMPPRMRTVFVLRYFEDMSEAEVARTMGCAVGSVKSQIARGLARLRTELNAEGSTR